MNKRLKTAALYGLLFGSIVLLCTLIMAVSLTPAAIVVPVIAALALIFGGKRMALLGMAGAVKVRSAMSDNTVITYASTGATVKDTMYLINGIPMLAINSADADATNSFLMIGLIEYAKLSAQAWTGGAKVYWDNGNSRFTTASGGNTLAGVASEAAANPSSTGFVYLNPFLVGTNQLENAIADPGTGVAIPVTASGVIAITTAAAETNTLAAPARVGLTLVLTMDVRAVGDRVITCATTVNQTGNNTLTFGAAGDTIVLYSTQIAGVYRWRVMANDGVGLTTA